MDVSSFRSGLKRRRINVNAFLHTLPPRMSSAPPRMHSGPFRFREASNCSFCVYAHPAVGVKWQLWESLTDSEWRALEHRGRPLPLPSKSISQISEVVQPLARPIRPSSRDQGIRLAAAPELNPGS